jgi:AraC-like DNA-binding protein
MDPLSDLLSLCKPRSYVSGGFKLTSETAIQWPQHDGIKCYAVVSGQCWLSVEGVREAVLLMAGDCYLLPPGPPFRLATNLSVTPVDYETLNLTQRLDDKAFTGIDDGCYLVGGHFVLTGSCADILMKSLPLIVHIRKESDKAAMRWSLERMNEEVRDPKPASSLIVQQVAFMMLAQALRLHLADGAGTGVGWLFALADKQLNAAITCMHDDPGYPWTLQNLATRVGMSRSSFAHRFKEKVGTTPMEYLTRWRMMLARDRLNNSTDPVIAIASSLGYESESAFGKAFRRIIGCSPRQQRSADKIRRQYSTSTAVSSDNLLKSVLTGVGASFS